MPHWYNPAAVSVVEDIADGAYVPRFSKRTVTGHKFKIGYIPAALGGAGARVLLRGSPARSEDLILFGVRGRGEKT